MLQPRAGDHLPPLLLQIHAVQKVQLGEAHEEQARAALQVSRRRKTDLPHKICRPNFAPNPFFQSIRVHAEAHPRPIRVPVRGARDSIHGRLCPVARERAHGQRDNGRRTHPGTN